MVTIQSLEVQFDVEGERDEAVFSRLFDQHIRRWSREREEQTRRRKQANAERSLGHGRGGEERE